MSASKRRCPGCLELTAGCVCGEEPEAVIAVPSGSQSGTCRHCSQPVVPGSLGWADPSDDDTDGYGCAESPSGWHEAATAREGTRP